MWKGQGYAHEFIHHMAHLCRVALEKNPACRNVEEEVLHGDACAGWCGHGLLPDHGAVLDLDKRTSFVGGTAGPQLHLRYGRDGGQRFATKAHGADPKEVVDIPDL